MTLFFLRRLGCCWFSVFCFIKNFWLHFHLNSFFLQSNFKTTFLVVVVFWHLILWTLICFFFFFCHVFVVKLKWRQNSLIYNKNRQDIKKYFFSYIWCYFFINVCCVLLLIGGGRIKERICQQWILKKQYFFWGLNGREDIDAVGQYGRPCCLSLWKWKLLYTYKEMMISVNKTKLV